MQRKIERQAKAVLHIRQCGQAGGSKRDTVIAALAADDLFLFRLADGGMVIPDHLDGRVVGFGAGITEKRLVEAVRRNRDQLFGKIDGRIDCLARKGMIVRQLFHLRRCCLDQFFFSPNPNEVHHNPLTPSIYSLPSESLT